MKALDRPLSQTLRDVASLINSSVDLDTTLQHLVDAACHNTVWAMGGVMAVDQKSGDALVVVRHDPNLLDSSYQNRWKLTTSPALLALTRNEPIIIRDAQAAPEFPGYQKEALKRGYRTVVVLPLGCKDIEGRAMVLTVQSRNVVDLSEADLAFLETIVHLGAIAVDKAHRLRAQRITAERLQNVLSAHSSLMRKVLSDNSTASAIAMIETFLPNPIVVVDLTANLVVAGRSPKPDSVKDEFWHEKVNKGVNRQFLRIVREVAGHMRPETGKLYLNCGDRHLDLPAMVELLRVDDETVGALIVFSLNTDFSDLDHLLLESAKFALSVQMMRHHLRFQAESQTASELFAKIVSDNGHEMGDLAARARRMGIDVDSPARLIAIGLPKGDGGEKRLADLHRSIVRLAEQQNPPVTAATLGDVTLCRVPGSGRNSEIAAKAFVRKLIDEAQWLFDSKLIMVIGKPCVGIQEHAQTWRECERMIRLAVRFNRTGLLAARDFGPFPLLLSAADTAEVRSFVDTTIGAVIRHDAAHGTDYVKTLTIFLAHGCRSQPCADAIGLHVTTLRYRLGRIQELFGIEIDTPERRFALELAIRLNETLPQEAHV